jgi:hypothetical protein
MLFPSSPNQICHRMKTDDPGPLNDLLAQWQMEVEPPTDFRREVWRRIAAEPCEPGRVERFAWLLLRPRCQAVILAIVVAVAVAWGLSHPPSAEFSPHDAYVMSISPFDPRHLGGH